MKPINKLTVAIALALGMGMVSPANATITLESGGKGDTLIFPFFAGIAENYFAIMNDHLFYGDRQTDENTAEQWVQIHIRFLGAGWSGELLDFDAILSPHDVMVFRVADVDGDGFWEVDQTLDPENFEYTGMLGSCRNELTGAVLDSYFCMDQSRLLIPPVGGNVDQPLINYHRQWGHIEVIGEGVLNGMTHATMTRLTRSAAGTLASQGQRRVGNQLGTHLWSWTNAGNVPGNADKEATDVPNVLSGTAFVTLPSASHGLSYNAEALVDFRTAANPHRIDNYTPTPAVIIHDEDASPNRAAGTSPAGDYVYGFPFNAGAVPSPTNVLDDRQDEARLRFSTTWGPTLADGDDYSPITPIMPGITRPVNGAGQDDWDATLTHNNLLKGANNINSIAEVEEAIRLSGQRYTGFWLNGQPVGFNPNNTLVATTLFSYYYALFPTKYFYGESAALANGTVTFAQYLNNAVSTLVGPTMSKVMEANLWDIHETPICPDPPTETCVTSPCETRTPTRCNPIVFQYEGQLKTIQGIESEILNGQQPRTGFVPGNGKFSTWPLDNVNNPGLLSTGAHPSTLRTWPLLLYTFELEATNPSPDGATVHHWKNMHR